MTRGLLTTMAKMTLRIASQEYKEQCEGDGGAKEGEGGGAIQQRRYNRAMAGDAGQLLMLLMTNEVWTDDDEWKARCKRRNTVDTGCSEM